MANNNKRKVSKMRWTVTPAVAAAILLAATSADAQDAMSDWSGLYAGVSAGIASINDDFLGYPGMHGPWEPWTGNSSNSLAGGLQTGFNYQMESLVLGVEGQFVLTGINGTALSSNGRPPFGYEANWLASLGPRIGYAAGNALLYVKGGVGIADLAYTHSTSAGDNTAYGFTLGGGAEYAFTPSLSGRIDYTYFGFSDDTTTLYEPNGTPRTMVNHDPDAHVMTVGLNYHF